MIHYIVGILTITTLLLLILIFIGLSKIKKLNKHVSLNETYINDTFKHICNADEQIKKAHDDSYRDLNMVEKTIMNRISQIDKRHCDTENELKEKINTLKESFNTKVVAEGVLKGPGRTHRK